MHLIDARHMTDEEIDCFQGDLRAFFIMLKDSYNRKHVNNVIATHRETWYALGAIKNDRRYIEYIDNVSDDELEGGINMCTTLDYYEAKGREEGREEGEMKHMIELIMKKVQKDKSLSQIADELETEAGEIQDIYNYVLQNQDKPLEEITSEYLKS